MSDQQNAFEHLKRLDERCERQRTALTKARGRRDALLEREREIVLSVGLAKGRLARKAQVTEVLEELQANANQRVIGGYAKLLTALVRDVLQQDISIGLELFTDHGLPALNIHAVKDGARLDIMDSVGGSLTNIVCLGLRIISTVRSGMRSILVLDEPDCWIEPGRIPAFYRVLKQLSDRMGFQAIVISHHDVGLFDGGINLISLDGTPEEGLTATVRAGAPKWADDEVLGIRSIVMRNFASYQDVLIPLSPGVNAIIGRNNIGKSRIVRMLRSVSYAGTESADSDIRLDERRAEAELRLEGRRTLHWSREIKRNPVTLWRLLDDEGNVVEVDGEHCNTGGKQAPEWLAKTLKIAKVHGLEIQLSHQKFPVFLINESASKQASVLSIGQESDKIRLMIATHKENSARDQNAVREGEREIVQVRTKLQALERLDHLDGLLDRAVEFRAAYVEGLERYAAIERHGVRISQAQRNLDRVTQALAVLAKLPAAPPDIEAGIAEAIKYDAAADRIENATAALELTNRKLAVLAKLPEGPVEIMDSSVHDRAADRIENAVAALELIDRKLAVLAKLPERCPEIRSSEAYDATADRIESLQAKLASTTAKLAVLEKLPASPPEIRMSEPYDGAADRIEGLNNELARIDAEIESEMAAQQAAAMKVASALSELGNRCPLCGGDTDHEHILAASTQAAAA